MPVDLGPAGTRGEEERRKEGLSSITVKILLENTQTAVWPASSPPREWHHPLTHRLPDHLATPAQPQTSLVLKVTGQGRVQPLCRWVPPRLPLSRPLQAAGCQSQASPPLPRLSSAALGAKCRAIMWLVMPSSPQLGPPIILSGLLLAPLYPQFVSLCLLRAYGGGPLRTLLIFSNLGVCMSQPVPQVRADNPFSISQLKESD